MNRHRIGNRNRPRMVVISGFTLLEIIVVLAIIAILVAVMAPSMIRVIDQEFTEQERKNLETIGTGTEEIVTSQRVIPGPANWAQSLAAQIESGDAQIAANSRGIDRRYVIDPNFGLALPYVQTSSGLVSPPSSPRLLIVSTIHNPGLPTADEIDDSFNALWGSDAPLTQAPWDSWGGRWEDLVVERINLEKYFHRLRIDNVDDVDNARFAIDYGTGVATQQDQTVRAPAAWERYFIHGTAVDLYDFNDTPEFQVREIIDEDKYYVYQNGMWQTGDFANSQSWIDSLVEDLYYWILLGDDDAPYNLDDLSISDEKFQQFQIQAGSAAQGN